jgi:hypothetical protein
MALADDAVNLIRDLIAIVILLYVLMFVVDSLFMNLPII